MAKKVIKDNFRNLNDDKRYAALAKTHKIYSFILSLAAIFVCFLIWAVMCNFELFAKTIVVTFIILVIYMGVSDFLDLREHLHHKNEK
ncbi:hypothetical protein PT285_08385 [Lactobacillus sp. ESL0791]|uniref:hypothetical protein n=1 Tax=Lactobacillus sp. ESL0791 TaxID=2983234 RepID=UPI0023F71D01|nr:hypothetical protein [Lactobacillus sp. ESL0791]MDF7639414.1 hypothetical protein [Lactobacillus sp. ESL0791]